MMGDEDRVPDVWLRMFVRLVCLLSNVAARFGGRGSGCCAMMIIRHPSQTDVCG